MNSKSSIFFLLAALTLTANVTRAESFLKMTDTPAPDKAVDPFLDQFARTYRFRLGKPTSFKLTPKGDAVLFLRSPNRSFVQDLYSFDVATGQERVLLTAQEILGAADEQLSAEEKARRERMRLAAKGLASFSLSEDGATIITSLSGRLFLVDRATRKVTEITSTSKSAAIDPHLSPDGKLLAHCRGRDLHITDLATKAEHTLAASDKETTTLGQAEFVAQEEMSRFRGYWFSPDSKLICYQGYDTTGMETFHIADPTKPENESESWPYPRAGKANATVWLEIKPVTATAADTPVRVTWDAQKYPYLAHVVWSKEGNTLAITVQNREQTDELLLRVDPATGATTQLLQEKDTAWVEIENENPKFLNDGSFLWVSETTGFKRIEHRNADGALKDILTDPSIGLQNLIHVDEDAGIVYFSASTNPTRTEIFTTPLKPLSGEDGRKALACGEGRFGLAVSDDHKLFLETESLLDGDTVWNVRSGTFSNKVGAIKAVTERPIIEPKTSIQVVHGERDYWTAVVLPKNFDKNKKYPVVAQVYAGPTALTVNASKWDYTLNQWLADQGYIVVSIDNRGTPNRGRDWSRAVKGNLIDKALEDQADGLKALSKIYPQMDMKKVGVAGWSFGGYYSAMAVMQRPDIYACGVAGAPVTDWRDYDTHYTERYMDLPQVNQKGYDAASCMTYAKDLSRPLLLIHGTSDDNVYFMHSLKLSEALFRAGKTFEFLPLSGFTHMVPDPVVTINLQQRTLDFFKHHLGTGPY